MKRLMLIFLVFCACPLPGSGQSESIASFMEEYGEGKKYYVYQSVMRILNVAGDKDFNKLIRNVRRIVVHQPNLVDSTGLQIDKFKILIDNLQEESFDPLIEARDGDMRITFFSRGDIKEAEFVLVLREQDKAYVAEVEGSLDMEYIGALARADISELTDYLK